MNWKEHLLRTLARLGLWRPGSLHYIGGSDVLPAPLSREEERACIARLAEGDQEASATLIEHNLRLVVYIARRFENTGINIEDLISIGTIGLIKAVGTYQPAKNIKLATYASRCIENEILMHLRKTPWTNPSAPTATATSFFCPIFWAPTATWSPSPWRPTPTARCWPTPWRP